jgi:pimeloyl-ACP methyl ester carboxylesterase
MPAIELRECTVSYIDEGQGMPLVLLHANPGDYRDFEAVIPALSQRYRVLALDWPGYGQSLLRRQADTVDGLFFYKVLREFLSALALPPAIFVGNSLGGNVAARLAVQHPEHVRGLVLVSPGGFTSLNPFSRFFCRFQGSRFSITPHLFAQVYLRLRTPATKAMLQRAATIQSAPQQLTLSRALWRSFGTADNDLRAIAHDIKAPTLLLFGKYDPIIPAKKDGKNASAAIPHAKLTVLPCGHAPFAEIPKAFLSEVEAFLATLGDDTLEGAVISKRPD